MECLISNPSQTILELWPLHTRWISYSCVSFHPKQIFLALNCWSITGRIQTNEKKTKITNSYAYAHFIRTLYYHELEKISFRLKNTNVFVYLRHTFVHNYMGNRLTPSQHRECILYSYVEMLIQMFLFFVSSRIISFVSQFSSSFFPVCFVATERETVFFVLLLPHIHNTQPYCCFVSSMADSNSSTVI